MPVRGPSTVVSSGWAAAPPLATITSGGSDVSSGYVRAEAPTTTTVTSGDDEALAPTTTSTSGDGDAFAPTENVTSGDSGAFAPMESATSGGRKAFAPGGFTTSGGEEAFAPITEDSETMSRGKAYAPIVEPVSPATTETESMSVSSPYRASTPTGRSQLTLKSMFVAMSTSLPRDGPRLAGATVARQLRDCTRRRDDRNDDRGDALLRDRVDVWSLSRGAIPPPTRTASESRSRSTDGDSRRVLDA